MYSDAYVRDISKKTKLFADILLNDSKIAATLVIVPASASRQFQPYLEALTTAKPDLLVIDGAFTKPNGFAAGDTGRTYEQVLANTTLDTTKLPAIVTTASRIWIIDDIYNTGNTVGAMVTRLRPHLLANVELIVACPLYVPMS